MKNKNANVITKTQINRSIKTIVSTIGIIFGIAGIGHGFFEALQGNNAIDSYIIEAIGTNNRMWLYGNEPAFTIIPNFLFTGITAMITGILIIIWSAGFMHRKYASLTFLLLFITLFLVGGGIGQIVFFVIGWFMSLFVKKPLNWWKKALPKWMFGSFEKLWLVFLIVASFLILFALEIAIFGFVPFVYEPNTISIIMISALGFGLLLLILSFVLGCANDINKGEESHE